MWVQGIPATRSCHQPLQPIQWRVYRGSFMAINAIRDFLKLESAGGLMLMAAAVLALLLANSALAPLYNLLHDLPVVVKVGALEVDKPLFLWVNDGLMAIFFFLVGLELKRELMEGELADRSQVILPAVAAFYTLMTLDSALRWRRGEGGRWKGRRNTPARP